MSAEFRTKFERGVLYLKKIKFLHSKVILLRAELTQLLMTSRLVGPVDIR